jgi:hypothetical protein
MKIDFNTIINVMIALLAFEVINRLFLGKLIDQIAPSSYEVSI